MAPCLYCRKLSKLRHLRLIFIFNHFGIFIIEFEKSLWSQLQTVGHSGQLSFQIVFFQARKGRLRRNLAVEMSTEVSFNFARSTHLFRCYLWQFNPFSSQQVVRYPVSIVICALPSLLCAFWSFLHTSHLSNNALQNIVVQVNTLYLPPKSNLFGFILFRHVDHVKINQSCFFARQGDSCPLQFLVL
jgi:hypothetical protein